MISVKLWGRIAARFLDDNAPVVLTGVAVVGASTIGYLTYKATNKAQVKVAEAYAERAFFTPGHEPDPPGLTQLEQLKITWQYYIPPACATVVTIGAVVGANHISTKRAAALAAAYTVSEKAFTEYKDKIVEKFNPTKEQHIRDEIAQDHVRANPPTDKNTYFLGKGKTLCLDKPSGRYFESDHEAVRQVQNDINRDVVDVGSRSLTDFYSFLGLPPTPMSDEIGFTVEALLDVHFTAALGVDNTPCMVIDYGYIPLRGFSANETM